MLEELKKGDIYRWHYGIDTVYFKLLDIEETIEGTLLYIQPLYKSAEAGTEGERMYVLFEQVKVYLEESNVGEVAIEMLKDVGDSV